MDLAQKVISNGVRLLLQGGFRIARICHVPQRALFQTSARHCQPTGSEALHTRPSHTFDKHELTGDPPPHSHRDQPRSQDSTKQADQLRRTSGSPADQSSDVSSLPKNPMPDFGDAEAAFRHKNTLDLYRSAFTFGICQIPVLVRYADGLLRLSRRIIGDWATDAFLKATLFGHFCAGTNRDNIRPAIHALEQVGIGSILDYAAEDDGETPTPKRLQPTPDTAEARLSESDTLPYPDSDTRKRTRVRVYDYTSEAVCDQHVQHFVQCIRDVAASKTTDLRPSKSPHSDHPIC
jgi:hypothetical protein